MTIPRKDNKIHLRLPRKKCKFNNELLLCSSEAQQKSRVHAEQKRTTKGGQGRHSWMAAERKARHDFTNEKDLKIS
jgi:hypothetical protein